MNTNLIELVCILDRSGSMSTMINDAIGGVNSLLQSQRESDKKVNATIVLFDTEYDVIYDGVDVKEIPEITNEVYYPRGGTALNDAVGKAVNTVGARLANTPEDERPHKVIVAITTDGQENMSREFSTNKIKEMIEHQRGKYSWEFIFLGVDEAAFAQAQGYGIRLDNTLSYCKSGAGVRQMYASINNAVTNVADVGNIGDWKQDNSKAESENT